MLFMKKSSMSRNFGYLEQLGTFVVKSQILCITKTYSLPLFMHAIICAAAIEYGKNRILDTIFQLYIYYPQ